MAHKQTNLYMVKTKICLLTGFTLFITLITLFTVQSRGQEVLAAKNGLQAYQALDLAPVREAPGTVSTLAGISAPSHPTDSSAPVLEHAATQEFPDVDGQRIVWQDARFRATDIFMKDLATGAVTNVTESLAWEVQPDLDGDIVVWKDGSAGVGIHGVDLTTGEVFTITTGHTDVSRPRLAGDVVVWADGRAGEDNWNIYGYDLATQTEFVISDAPSQERDPQIDGDYVVWWDEEGHVCVYDVSINEVIAVLDTVAGQFPDVSMADQLVVWQDWRNGDIDIYGYDLAAKTEIPLVVAAGFQQVPALADGLLTYQSQVDGTSWHVYVRVLDTNQSFRVTDNPNIQLFPSVDGTLVAWADNRNHQMDIYYFEWTGDPPIATSYPLQAPTALQVGAVPGGKIRVQWAENSIDEAGFAIERAQGITGTVWQEIAEISENTTVYTDTPQVLGESYWYRVRAKSASGFSEYTSDSFNSTFDVAPSPDEQYLMVLVNEARLAPSAFGHPQYAPVPPVAMHPSLAYSAHSHSQSVLNSGLQFGHCDPSGRCAGDRAMAVGYPHNRCTETLTTGATGPDAMVAAHQNFMNSELHRNIILDPNADEFGVGHTFTIREEDNSVSGQMTEVFCARDGVTPPAVPMGAVIPYTGTVDTSFTYAVNFYDAEGQAPTKAEVVIDGVAYPLTLSTGVASQGTYRYTTTLEPSTDHSYYYSFQYADGTTERWPETGASDFPDTYSGTEPDLVPSLHITAHVDSFEIEGDIYNAGINAAPNTSVYLYVGDPDEDGELLYQTSFAEVAGGEHQYITHTWDAPGADTYTFHLRVESSPAGTGTIPILESVVEDAQIESRHVYLPLATNGDTGQ